MPASPGLRVASSGYMLTDMRGMRVKTYRQNEIEGTFIEVNDAYVPKAIATNSAYLIKDTDK